MFGKTSSQGGGIGMLLKSMGLDPEVIQASVADMSNRAQNVVNAFDKRLSVIETQQAEILSLLRRQHDGTGNGN